MEKDHKHTLKLISEGFATNNGFISPVIQCTTCKTIFVMDRFDQLRKVQP